MSNSKEVCKKSLRFPHILVATEAFLKTAKAAPKALPGFVAGM